MKISTLAKLSAASSLAALAMVSAPALAQDAAGDAVAENSGDDGVILVTGSRIVRPNFDAVQPTLVVGEEFIEERGFTNVADAINEIPAFGLSDANGTDAQGISGVGQNFVDLFGLGSQRTLTVVNGRRFVAANAPSVFNAAAGLQVDLNVIPIGLIDRVETIAVTGAPIYGSDAIAGTVNVILKRDYEGLELTGSYGITERGDGQDYLIRGLVGGNFADGRGNIAVSAEYNKRDGLIQSDRPETLGAGFSFQTNPLNGTSDDGIPDRVLIRDARVSFGNFDGLPSFEFGNPFIGLPVAGPDAPIYQFDSTGNLVPFDAGERFGAVFSQGGDGVNLSELSNLVTPYERTLLTAIARYEITTGVEAYAEAFYARTQARDQISQAVWNTDFFSGDSAALEFSVDNPFLTPAARAQIQDNCDDYGLADCTFLLSRSGRSIARGNNETTQNLYRIVAGVRGDFEVLGRDLNYDVSLNYGRTDNTSISDGISNRRFAFALDAVSLDAASIGGLDASETLNVVRNGAVLMDVATSSLQVGDIACAVELTRPTQPGGGADIDVDIDSCVPLNYFGAANTSPEAASYVNIPFGSNSFIEQRIFDANINGGLFDLPAGEVGFSVSYQHREESAAFNPDTAYVLGLGRTAPLTPTEGEFKTDEFAAELRVPILSPDMNLGPISSLIGEGAARYVDNSRAGGDWTWTAGGSLGFFDDQIRFRGNYTQSIRSPALVELFLPTATTFSRANDPCDASNVGGGPDPATRRANCLAEAQSLGLTEAEFNNFQSVVINGTRQGTTGGNPTLRNEQAKSYTAGVVLRPNFQRNLMLSVDYVNISIEDAVSDLGLVDVMNACYDSPDFPNEYCDRFDRAPAGDPNGGFQVVDGFNTGYINAGSQDFEAVTAELAYRTDLGDIFGGGDIGALNVRGSLFHLLRDERSVTGFDFDNRRGQIARSKWRGQLNLSYDNGPVSVMWQTRYIGPAIFDNDDTPESRDLLGVGDYWLFNAGVTFRPADEFELQFNVNNVFDTKGPYGAYASAAAYTYDFMGRSYRVTATTRF